MRNDTPEEQLNDTEEPIKTMDKVLEAATNSSHDPLWGRVMAKGAEMA